MDIIELEELLQEYMPALRFEKNRKGELIIYTGLKENDEEQLVLLDEEEVEEDPDFTDDEVEPYEEDDDEE